MMKRQYTLLTAFFLGLLAIDTPVVQGQKTSSETSRFVSVVIASCSLLLSTICTGRLMNGSGQVRTVAAVTPSNLPVVPAVAAVTPSNRPVRLVAQQGHQQDVSSFAFSPDGRLVLTGSWDHTAKLWDASTGAELRTFSGHSGVVDSVAFSPDGRLVLTGRRGRHC